MGHVISKKLLVEGEDDKHALISLMRRHIAWGSSKEDWPVEVKACDGAQQMLAQHAIPLELKSAALQTLGIVLDVNDSCSARWTRLRTLCAPFFPDMDDELSPNGLICDNSEGKRLGIWIMPDNQNSGMLETFLQYLVPDHSHELWDFAKECVSIARTRGAGCRESHIDKANIFTWLAWADPPGQRLGTALLQSVLDPMSDRAMAFVSWFRTLYAL
jgi:hypothetical protein